MNKGIVNLEESEKGSGFGEVFGIIAAGSFADSTDIVENGKKVVGEMSLFEKGIFTYLHRLDEKEKSIINAISAVARDAEADTFKRAMGDLGKVRKSSSYYRKALNHSIRERFDVGDATVSICNDFKIAIAQEQDKEDGACDCLICSLMKGTKGLSGIGIEIIRV